MTGFCNKKNNIMQRDAWNSVLQGQFYNIATKYPEEFEFTAALKSLDLRCMWKIKPIPVLSQA